MDNKNGMGKRPYSGMGWHPNRTPSILFVDGMGGGVLSITTWPIHVSLKKIPPGRLQDDPGRIYCAVRRSVLTRPQQYCTFENVV